MRAFTLGMAMCLAIALMARGNAEQVGLAGEAKPTTAEVTAHVAKDGNHQQLLKTHAKASELVKELTHKASLVGVALPADPGAVEMSAVQQEMQTKERRVKRMKRYPKASSKETAVKRVYEIMEKTSMKMV